MIYIFNRPFKTRSMKKILLLLFSAAALLTSCEKDALTPEKQNLTLDMESAMNSMTNVQGITYYGEPVQLGNNPAATARSYVKATRDGKPIAAGVEFSHAAMADFEMHAGHDMGTMEMDGGTDGHEHEMGSTFFIPFPTQGMVNLPYSHISVDWATRGHGPEQIYDVPHFDVHFYIVSPDLQGRINMDVVYSSPSGSPFDVPAIAAVPKEYFPGPFVPMMGTHWISKLAPEFNGSKFTHTFIYGTHNNKVVFFEPMVTLETFMGMKEHKTPISQPLEYPTMGKYYAKQYSILYDRSRMTHNVQMDNFFLPEKRK